MSDDSIAIPRVLDLGLAEDQVLLRTAVARDAELVLRIEAQLANYLRWFRDPAWRTVYSGGLVSGPGATPGHAGQGYSIAKLLQITECLASLQDYHGFDRVL